MLNAAVGFPQDTVKLCMLVAALLSMLLTLMAESDACYRAAKRRARARRRWSLSHGGTGNLAGSNCDHATGSEARPGRRYRARNVDPAAGIVDDHDREAPANRVFGRIPDAKIERQAGQKYALDAALAKITGEAGRRRAIVLVERRVRIDGPVETLAQHQPGMGNL